jgi:hypothetical protein
VPRRRQRGKSCKKVWNTAAGVIRTQFSWLRDREQNPLAANVDLIRNRLQIICSIRGVTEFYDTETENWTARGDEFGRRWRVTWAVLGEGFDELSEFGAT